MLSNSNVMLAFLRGQDAKDRNLTSMAGRLVNYQTVIAYSAAGAIIISTKRYSRATSKIQSQLRNLCINRGYRYVDVYSCENM